jgi:regulator of sigma E protease
VKAAGRRMNRSVLEIACRREEVNHMIVILIVGILILAHELGHFVAARWAGIPISRFSVGFGPKLWRFRIGETEFCLSLFLIGGYVVTQKKFDLDSVSIGRRSAFLLGGPAANLAISLILFLVLELVLPIYAMQIDLQLPEDTFGLIAIIAEADKIINNNFANMLLFSAFLSLNLSILNMLPIPPLDGGSLLLLILEKLNQRSIRAHSLLNAIGCVLVVLCMIVVAVNDLARYVV